MSLTRTLRVQSICLRKMVRLSSINHSGGICMLISKNLSGRDWGSNSVCNLRGHLKILGQQGHKDDSYTERIHSEIFVWSKEAGFVYFWNDLAFCFLKFSTNHWTVTPYLVDLWEEDPKTSDFGLFRSFLIPCFFSSCVWSAPPYIAWSVTLCI